MGIKKPNTVAVPPLFIISMAPRKSFTPGAVAEWVRRGITVREMWDRIPPGA